jgi:hypothetical protein
MEWTANRIFALIVGIVFTLIGILGFFSTTTLAVGTVLFVFHVDVIHNVVHLVTGLIALAAAFSTWAWRFNQVFGVIYVLLGIAGLFYPALYFDGRLLGLMHVNAADHILHLVVGAIAIFFGFSASEYRTGRLAT